MANYITSDHGILQLNFGDMSGTITAAQFAGTATNGYSLQLVSGVPTWASVSATNATNVSGGAANSLVYQTGAGATGFIAAGTNGYILSSVSGVPTWTAPVAGTTITGTANQVIASASTGPVTLSLPQSIATTSTPTFSTLTLGASSSTIGGAVTSYGSMAITGSSTNYAGINYTASSGNMIAMYSTNSNIYGVYCTGTPTGGATGWQHYWTGGTLTVGTIPAANVSGTVASATTAGSCSGNAATATTATNQSGGTVSATTGAFSSYVNVGGGTASTTAGDLCLTRSGGTTGALFFANATQYIYFNATIFQFTSGITSSGVVTATGFTVSSDRNLKTNIQPITNAEDIVASLNGVRFDWKDSGKASVGLIAQDVEVLLPELVEVNETTGFKGVNYDAIMGVLIEEVKSLRKELNALKAR